MSAWVVTMGAGAMMGSCIRRLPFHPKDGIGPESITVTSEMAKHNSRALIPMRRQRRNACGLHIQPLGAHGLNGVHHQQYVACCTALPESFEVHTIPGIPLDRAAAE